MASEQSLCALAQYAHGAMMAMVRTILGTSDTALPKKSDFLVAFVTQYLQLHRRDDTLAVNYKKRVLWTLP